MNTENYTLDLTYCNSFEEIIAATKADLNARKQLMQSKNTVDTHKRSWLKGMLDKVFK